MEKASKRVNRVIQQLKHLRDDGQAPNWTEVRDAINEAVLDLEDLKYELREAQRKLAELDRQYSLLRHSIECGTAFLWN